MQIKRTCKVCGKKFVTIKTTQFFDTRSCFRKAYYRKKKGLIQDIEQSQLFPLKKCSVCNTETRLTFDPLKNPKLFTNWNCPNCCVPNKLIWKHVDANDSNQVINHLISTISKQNTIFISQKVEYKIPVKRLDNSTNNTLILTCDILSILDTQIGNRRRITFS